jgi:SAM-dependent methyltransferase
MDNKNIYEKFDWSALGEPALKGKIQKVLDIIPESVDTIVDIGCGNGVITNVLGKSFDVTAVDRSEKALCFVQTKKVVSGADNIPLPNASFDMVFSSEMLEHLEDGIFKKSVAEMKRLTKKYIFITVPNDENPDKLSIQCPSCKFIYNSPNHLRSFKALDFEKLFPEFKILSTLTFGKNVRYYNKKLLQIKKKISPAKSWIPNYWMPENKRRTICPNCENEFDNRYQFNPLATAIDLTNVLLSPKKPYWLFVLMEKKQNTN